MNTKMQNMFTPRRKRGKTWDAEAGSGYLWLWTGSFKRWKRRRFSTAQPGLLTYKGRQKRGKSTGAGGSINLRDAVVEASSEDSRMITICGPGSAKVYLRTTDADDRDGCVESIRTSAAAYDRMLARASALLGVPPGDNEISETLKQTASAKAAKLSGELLVAHELQERVKARMHDLAPYQQMFQDQLHGIQSSLRGIAASLDLGNDEAKTSEEEPQPKDMGQLSEAALHSHRAEGRLLTHAESFQSALSELQKSPSWQEGITPDRAAPFAATPLGKAWGVYSAAVEEIIRAEATRIVELQAENDALKAGMRNFKLRAESNAKKLRALAPLTEPYESSPGPISLERLGSSDSEELSSSVQTPRQSSLERQLSATSHDLQMGVDLKALSSAMTSEYQQALDALEAVRRHAFAVNTQVSRKSFQATANVEPPPAEDLELEDLGSDEDGKSEMGSHRRIRSQAENAWEIAAQRDRLPAPAPLQRGFSIWSVLKNAIGKDLTRITLPATINEPLSALQRIAEDLEYRHLLDEAQATTDPAMRALLIAAFIASGYSGTLVRESKPFNPLLGETFEWQSADSSCRFVCEQVSHHPPVSCWWSESLAGWQYWGEIELRSKFWGKSVEMMPTGTCWLKLGQELWSWNKANMTINNIILGTYWLDWHGTINIRNHSTGATVVLKFPKSSGKQLDHRGTVECTVQAASGHPAYELRGKYTESMAAVPLGLTGQSAEEKEIFRVNPPVEQGSLQYNLSRLAMTLNTAEPELLRQLPPTDSRLRPDQRALEDGDLDKATPEKLRLEEKQRQARKLRKESGESFFPCWFKLRGMTAPQQQGADHWLGSALVRLPEQPPPSMWEFTGEYWESKQRLDWGRCPNIYSAE